MTKRVINEAYCGWVPMRTGSSIIPRGCVLDPLKPTRGVAMGRSLSLEIPSWSKAEANIISDELPVSISTRLTVKLAMVSVTTKGSS